MDFTFSAEKGQSESLRKAKRNEYDQNAQILVFPNREIKVFNHNWCRSEALRALMSSWKSVSEF
jgi:hypothetical protein